MAVSRTNFRAGDRVRGAEWFDEIAGVVGTVVQAVEVRGDDWAAQDLLVRFDRPVVTVDEPQWTYFHSAHNFEYVEDTRTALPAAMDESFDAEDPEATVKQELEDRSALIEALTERAQRERILLDLERERVTRADVESRLSRA